jgi:hypothetical protein
MKRVSQLFIVIALVCVGSTVYSAEAKVGIGAHQTTFGGKGANETYSAQWGLHLGANAMIGERQGWVFSPGVEYDQRKSSFTNTINGVPFSGNVNLQYLDVPLYAMYRFNDFANIYAGPVIALNLSATCDAPGCGNVNGATVLAGVGAGVKIIEDLGVDFYIKKGFGDAFSNSATGSGGTSMLDVGLSLTDYIY